MPDKCTECPLVPRVEALERSNEQHGSTHREMYGRLNALERLSDVQENKLTNIDDKLDDIQAGQKNILTKVEALEAKPAKWWERTVGYALSAIVGAFILWVASGMPGAGG